MPSDFPLHHYRNQKIAARCRLANCCFCCSIAVSKLQLCLSGEILVANYTVDESSCVQSYFKMNLLLSSDVYWAINVDLLSFIM